MATTQARMPPPAREGIWQRFVKRFYVPLMLAPVVVIFASLFLGALIVALLQSFGYAPLYNVNEFPTLRNYRELISQPGFWQSVGLTFYYAIVPTVLGTAFSAYLALVLRRRFRGKALFNYVYKLPLMIPYLVGVALTIVLFANGGIIARSLHLVGLIESTRDFPRILLSHGGWGIMLVYLWKQIPFTTLIVYSVLMGLGPESEEAALTLGASRWQTFWHVTLPQIMPGIVSATIIVFAFNFGSFEVPFILGAKISPFTLPVEAWRAFDDADYTRRLRAMAIVMVISLISSVLLISYLSVYRFYERRRGRV
ncbi:MAG: sugar ABC transporter permease [Trueperaceae bacterium]|nr:MAG: sugar ABC transporter permease [Trueperaceae bacterium]